MSALPVAAYDQAMDGFPVSETVRRASVPGVADAGAGSGDKALCSLIDPVDIFQERIFPHMLAVVLVETLDASLGFGITNGGEDQLRSRHQRQTDHLAQDAGMGEAAAEAADLRKGGHALSLP